MKTPYPTQLEKRGEMHLRITWSDGMLREYTVRDLRDECPCATCREKRSAPPPPPTELPIIAPGAGGPITITTMRPVGSYAYGITFSDGHDTGLFTLEFLRELGDEIEASG
ncbi:MAG: gamma-butyrobetaine hydroxylase-like domain-containing protein [Aeoliella sp.]